MSEPLVLGIETSCDETAVGIVRGRKLLANVIASSVDEHARFGGVVPEVASRAHLEAMQPTIKRAIAESKVSLKDLDAILVPISGGGMTAGIALAAKALKPDIKGWSVRSNDLPVYCRVTFSDNEFKNSKGS